MGVNRRVWGRAFWAIAIVSMMVLGAFQVAGYAAATGAFGASSPSGSTTSAAATTVAGASSAATAAASPATDGPHPGTIEAYEPVPLGATTTDPALAYDTTSYEVILNVYQTLINYNGSSTTSYVPTLATCVPLQGDQCALDYGAGFTGVYNATGKNYTGSNGQPVYWTYVLDPAARFYDPSTGASWRVYPTDVMFSIARALIWSTYPYVEKTAGWIMAQALLPGAASTCGTTVPSCDVGNDANPYWDNGLHYPYNNTPSNVYASMLVNDSAFCPAGAMNGLTGDGCITFVANGSGQDWLEFPEFVADNLGASVVPCGWYTYAGGNITGWAGTKAAKGDGSCTLPDGGNTTNNSAWTTYLATQAAAPKSWDNLMLLNTNWPATEPGVQWSMVGSGPYYAAVNPHLSYALAANPAYVQPSGCSGRNGLAKYTGYCDPAPGGYIPNVDVTWETAAEGDSLGTDAIEAGTADFAGIYTTQTSTLLGYVHSGLWQYLLFPTLSTAYTTINFGVSYSAYNTTFAGTPLEANPIPPALFTTIGLRNFYIAAYPYTTIQNTINTVDGIQFSFEAGGPIPNGLADYYPNNVSWPYYLGDPTQGPTVVGSAAWWWAQLTDPSSSYYNATVVSRCTSSNPCTWPIGYYDGSPANLPLIEDWDAQIYAISDHRLSPWPLALSFTQFLTESLVGAYESPLASVIGFGWAPDYPDPTDYVGAIVAPNGAYTAPDTVSAQLALPQYEENVTCGHYGIATLAEAFANLSYWANVSQNPANGKLDDACQGVAYNLAGYFMTVAGALPAGAERVLDYNLVTQITTALGLYVWNGQGNELVGFAPWIDPSSINTNPMIGGGGDTIWFQIHYRSVYVPTIAQTGLPSGTSWSASVGGLTLTGTGGQITFPAQPNATYNFTAGYVPGYTVSPSNGTVKITGAPQTVTVTYTPIPAGTKTIRATYNETGIVTGTAWSLVVVGYGSQSTLNPSMTYTLPQSTKYGYVPQEVVGYLTPSEDNVTVGTSATYTTVAYVGLFGATYQVVFTQSGLTNGTGWSVTLGSAGSAFTLSSTTPTIVFFEQNGTLNYTIGAPSGYSAVPNTGSVTIAGTDRQAAVAFFKSTSPAWDYLSPLAYGVIGLLAVLMLIGFALAGRNARRGQPAKSPEKWTGTEQQTPPSGDGGSSPPSDGSSPKT